jgi:hypothetical protein
MYKLLFVFLFAIALAGCIDRLTDEPIENVPPTTRLWLIPDDTLRTTTSRQHIHWSGDDPDGFVVGFEWSFDDVTWVWTARNDSIFQLPLRQQDSVVTFHVRAIDNEGAHDPDPPSLSIPIKNSPPRVEFLFGTDVPDTTFTVATFAWDGTDPDGDETIQNYYWALNDTTEWNTLPGDASILTLYRDDGLRLNDRNVFYLKAVDNAGAFSTTARMPGNPAPDNPDRPPDTTAYWYVREPIGDLLIIDDYSLTDGAERVYREILDTLAGGRFMQHTVWDIRRGRTDTQRGELVPAYINPTFVETLRLFDYVLWYADNSPTYAIAQLALPRYLETGGKILMSITFPPGAFDPREQGLVDFAPIDSVSTRDIGFMPPHTVINTTPEADALGYPTLVRDGAGFDVGGVREIVPQTGAVPLYRVAPSTRWEGEPLVAVKAEDNSIVLIALRLHRMNGTADQPEQQNVGRFLHKVLIDEFGAD